MITKTPKMKALKNGAKKRRSNNGKKQDRLSSLPEPLLVDILSLLPIDTAATMSVLSRPWRNLWTQVTSLHFDHPKFTPRTLKHVLSQLTSPKVNALRMVLGEGSSLPYSVSCFRHAVSRKVEEIEVIVEDDPYFCVPTEVFNCRSLVALELSGSFQLDCMWDDDDGVCLPKLKKLTLQLYDDSGHSLGTLFRSCPLLEELSLEFGAWEGEHFVEIFCPNLISLRLRAWSRSWCKFVVNTPRLMHISVIGCCVSSCCFVESPIALIKAFICLEDADEEEDGGVTGVDALVLDLFKGVCSVVYLDLSSNSTRVFKQLKTMGDGVLMFRNLTHLKTSLSKSCSWIDLLFSLRAFPKLEVLEVRVIGEHEHKLAGIGNLTRSFGPLLSKLKRITIGKLKGNYNEIKLLKFILSNASALERFVVRVRLNHENKQVVIRKEKKFWEKLFKLRRSSLTCEVEICAYQCIK